MLMTLCVPNLDKQMMRLFQFKLLGNEIDCYNIKRLNEANIFWKALQNFISPWKLETKPRSPAPFLWLLRLRCILPALRPLVTNYNNATMLITRFCLSYYVTQTWKFPPTDS